LEPVVIENYEKNNNVVEFEVLTAVVMKSSVFWDITVCSPLQVRYNTQSKIFTHAQS
jgi:hypothetical protein